MRHGEGDTAVLVDGDRKADHLRLALRGDMQLSRRYLDGYVLEHRALPEIDLREVDPGTHFLGHTLRFPLLISCMTGGTEVAATINRNLAEAAERCGVALGVGSQRKALEDPGQIHTFQVRRWAPSVPLLANLGAVQLNYGFSVDECRAAVEMIDGDALVFHLNPLQEAIQPEGQTDFGQLLPKLKEVTARLGAPVIVKEVGCGIPASNVRALAESGVRIIDTAGVGGTSWARIEAQRAGDLELGELFADWGIPTPLAIRAAASVEGVTVIGSGGLRTGVDAAKAIALGADLVGMAQPFLEAAMDSADAVVERIERIGRELRIAMFLVGARSVEGLKRARFLVDPGGASMPGSGERNVPADKGVGTWRAR